MNLSLIVLLLLILPYFYAWCWIHEYSHLLAVRFTVGESYHKIRIWPKFHDDGIEWARITWKPEREATVGDRFVIGMAPRLAGLVAAFLLPWTAFVPGLLGMSLTWFCLFGLIDTLTGSIGQSERSDLKKVSNGNSRWLWTFRVFGFFVVLCSAGLWLILQTLI